MLWLQKEAGAKFKKGKLGKHYYLIAQTKRDQNKTVHLKCTSSTQVTGNAETSLQFQFKNVLESF